MEFKLKLPLVILVLGFILISNLVLGKAGFEEGWFFDLETFLEDKKEPRKCLENCCLGKQLCSAKVEEVIDGDTIKLETGEKVRYVGIDTPESVHPQKEPECLAKETGEINRELVAGKEVVLLKDISDIDKYGRLLRYVYCGEIFINEFLVENGWARAVSYPPDLKYQNLFKEAEKKAQKAELGFWKAGVCDKETGI